MKKMFRLTRRCQKNDHLRKIWMTMKLTVVLFFLAISQMMASEAYSQVTKVSLHMKDAAVKEVLNKIEENSEFVFLYNSRLVNVDRKVSIDYENQKIAEILNDLFKEADVVFTVVDRQIVLTNVDDQRSFMALNSQKEKTISGKVTDSSGATLPGVSIVVKGTTNGTITDADGNYSFSNVPENATLQFSFVGMKAQEVAVAGKSTVNVKMEEDAIGIEEVVAIGYGVSRKVDLTGAVSSVSSNDIIKVSAVSTAQAIQGRMTGVQITQNSGAPGSSSTIKIRGIGSIRSDNNPLILVDGYSGSIDDVDADDIESISVLKDASSAAIYGARAANGVILITTKRGKSGKILVDFKAEYGVSSLTKMPGMLKSRDFATKVNEERVWSGSGLIWTGDYAPEKLSGGTDWWDVIYNLGSLQDYYLGISGGSEITKYALSFGYLNQDGVIDNTNYNKGNVRFNFDHKFNKWLKIGTNIAMVRSMNHDGNENMGDDKNGYNGYGLGIAAIRAAPSIPIYFENGDKGLYLKAKPGEYPLNGTLPPHWYMGIRDNNRTYTESRGSTFAEVSIIDGLSFKSVVNAYQGNISVSNWVDSWEAYSPDYTTPIQSNSLNALTNRSDNNFGWEIQELLTYKKTFNNHSINALAGFSSEKSYWDYYTLAKENFPNNELHVMNAGSVVKSSGGSESITAYTSLFGRLNYDYASRYLLSATVRRDGSSAFAPGNQFGVFPSVSGAWRISEESFMKSQGIVTNLKIRAGYGELGNAKIPAYSWISSYFLNDAHPFGITPQITGPAYYITGMTNENVKWETTTTTDIGLDVGFIENKLNLEFDYYNKSTTDLLMNATVPITAGDISGPIVNIGEVENKGWEITARWDDKIGDFSYGFSANISHNENKVVDMGGLKPMISGNIAIKEGYPINSYWGYKTDGIWRTLDELSKNPHRNGDIRPGDYRYIDISGPEGKPDGIINSDDQTYLGDPNPDYYYGLSGYASWKGFDVSFLLNGEAAKQTMINSNYGGGYIPSFNSFQYFFDNRAILDPTTKEVVSGTTNASGANPGNGSESTLFDISYLRVKNIQFGYTLPKNIADQLNMNSLRVYVNATNPVMFTDYFGWDQESTAITGSTVNNGGNNYVPVQKTFSFGISVKF